MTAMAEKMRESGLDTDKARLDSIACDVLRQAKQNVESASQRFLKIVRSDADLMAALFGESVLEQRAEAYLRLRAEDMRPTRDGVSQLSFESQPSNDHSVPASNKVRSSHVELESPATDDRPAPTRGVVSQRTNESQKSKDRHSPPPTKISKVAAARVAKNSIYDMSIGMQLTFRTAKLYDIINNERAGSRYTRMMTLLRTSKQWPDDAAVPDVYSEKELKAIIKKADEALPPLPVEAFSHG